MNPSGGGWNNPPPPGTEVTEELTIKIEPATNFELDSASEDRLCSTSKMKVEEMLHKVRLEYENESSATYKIKSEPGEETFQNKGSDRMDSFFKNSDSLEFDKKRHSHSRDRSRHRRRSHSRSRHSDKHKKSRGKHRSRSRDRHRRSRSRGHRHHRHRSSSSSRSKHSKSKREKRNRRSSSPSRTRSRRHYSKTRHDVKSDSEKEDPTNTSADVDEDDEPSTKENAFKNDGSFLEMFKKMQEEQQQAAKEQAGSSDLTMVPPVPKRRGGRILKTGLVEKAKVIDEFMQGDGLDAWSVYMKEVKRYKEACCDDDSKTRPLVK